MLVTWCMQAALAAPFGHAAHLVVVGAEGRGARPGAVAEARAVARDLREAFAVDASLAELLEEPDRAAVEHAFSDLARHLAGHAAVGEPATVVFVFVGAADGEGLVLADGHLPLERLRALLGGAAVGRELVVVDVEDRTGGAFTAEALDGLAHERRALAVAGGWGPGTPRPLAAAWASGLLGPADANGDGAITVGEAYAHAAARAMVVVFDPDAPGRRARVEARLVGMQANVLLREAACADGAPLR